MRMSESNPQTPFTCLGGSLGCMVHSEGREGGGRREGGMEGWRDG